MSLRSAYIIKEVFFPATSKIWDYCLWMPDYQDFQIIRYHIKGILLYMHNMTVTGNEVWEHPHGVAAFPYSRSPSLLCPVYRSLHWAKQRLASEQATRDCNPFRSQTTRGCNNNSQSSRDKTALFRVGLLGPLLNKNSDLSIRNGVLLYKQLIRNGPKPSQAKVPRAKTCA